MSWQLPDTCGAVRIKLRVFADDRHALNQRLCNEEAVEGIAVTVVVWERADAQGMIGRYWQELNPGQGKLLAYRGLEGRTCCRATQLESAQTYLDGHLPEACDAQIDVIRATDNSGASSCAESRAILDKPDERVGIYEKRHGW